MAARVGDDTPGANPATETYSYDPLYRLTAVTEADGSTLESATYNPTGDRLSKTGAGLDTGAYGYNSGTHQLTSTGNLVRSVDANGNTTAITQATGVYGFGYNDRNRMTVAQLANSTVGTYTYNEFNERVQKVANGSTERFGYDEGSKLLGEYGADTRDYVWLDNIPVANVDTSGTTSSIAYVTADQLGTPRAIADASGTTQWQWAYAGNPWGEMAPLSTGYSYNPRFPGQYADAETGLSQNVNRDYDAAVGRYVESDPVGLAGGSSTYVYVNGTPLKYLDSTGRSPGAGDESEEEMEAIFPRQLGPNMADPANQNVIRQQLAECKAPWNTKPPIIINPADVAGLTPAEIDALARRIGLDAKGPDPMNGRGSYTDPDTGIQRVLSYPDAEPPHAHVNDPMGNRLDINGNQVPNESPEAHLPITK